MTVMQDSRSSSPPALSEPTNQLTKQKISAGFLKYLHGALWYVFVKHRSVQCKQSRQFMHRKHRYKTIPLFSYFSSCSFSHPLCNKQAVIEAILLSAATEHHFERTAVESRSHWIQSGFSPFDEEAMLTSFSEYFLCRLVKVEKNLFPNGIFIDS